MSAEIGIILASHGNFATEALKSLEMIVGQQTNIKTLALNPGENLDDLTVKMEDAYATLDKTNGVVIICDILGGTPSNAATRLLLSYPDDNLSVYTGLNLAVLLEFTLNRSMDFEDAKITLNNAAENIWSEVQIKKEKKSIEMDGDL